MQSINTKEKASSGDMIKHSLFYKRLPFPVKVHIMLDDITKDSGGNDEHSTIVSWQHHGRAFRVHNPHKFEKTIMPKYFNQTKYKSFQRQLHIYSFQRISSGVDKGAYYHKSFIRNQPHLGLRMDRNTIKSFKNLTQLSPCKIDQKFYAYVKMTSSKSNISERNMSMTNMETIVPSSADVVPSSTLQDLFSVEVNACHHASQELLLIDPVTSCLSTNTDNRGHISSRVGSEFNKLDRNYDYDNNFETLGNGEEVSFEGRTFFFVNIKGL